MLDAQEWIDLANDLLNEFGVLFPGEKIIAAHRDSNGVEIPGSRTPFTTLGVVQEYSKFEKANSTIEAGDVRFICDNSTLLNIGDRIRINGVYWRVVEPNPVIPDGEITIVHRAQMRRVAL